MLAKTYLTRHPLVLRCFSSATSKTLKVGDVLREARVFSSEDVKGYAEVSHDWIWNPLIKTLLVKPDSRILLSMGCLCLLCFLISSLPISLEQYTYLKLCIEKVAKN